MKVILDIPEPEGLESGSINDVLNNLCGLVISTKLPSKDKIRWGGPNRLSWFDAREIAEQLTSKHKVKHHLIQIFLRIGQMEI